MVVVPYCGDVDAIVAILQGLWLILPALVANSAAVLFGGGRPIDGGAVHKDGRRVLGDGKTWRGLIGGTAFGLFIGLLMIIANSFSEWPEITFGTFPSSVIVIFSLSFGALVGDLIGSYVKRRMGMGRGQKAPVLDQYDFLIFALLLVAILQWPWFFEHYINGYAILGLIVVIALTPILHRVVNIIGHRMGKKEVPW
jgi:CDP-2,3-bis-(O-geranylgeranyl)-sn-glycerol synthase